MIEISDIKDRVHLEDCFVSRNSSKGFQTTYSCTLREAKVKVIWNWKCFFHELAIQYVLVNLRVIQGIQLFVIVCSIFNVYAFVAPRKFIFWQGTNVQFSIMEQIFPFCMADFRLTSLTLFRVLILSYVFDTLNFWTTNNWLK